MPGVLIFVHRDGGLDESPKGSGDGGVNFCDGGVNFCDDGVNLGDCGEGWREF